MRDLTNNYQEFVTVFIRFMIRHVVNGTVQSMMNLLQQGPPGRIKDPREVEIQKWFLNLKENERTKVLEIVQTSVLRTIFNTLVLLDNKWEGYPIEDKVSDLALNIQLYNNQNALYNYEPEEVVRINRSYSNEMDLHDYFMNEISKCDNPIN